MWMDMLMLSRRKKMEINGFCEISNTKRRIFLGVFKVLAIPHRKATVNAINDLS